MCGLLVAFVSYDRERILDRYRDSVIEIGRLRIFNARRDKRLHRPPASPRLMSADKAAHILGTPAPVVLGVWFAENGPPDIETGSIGKTDWIALGFPMEDWAALEAARSMNRFCWQWFQTADGKRALPLMLKYAAGPYTALGEEDQRQWVKTVSREILKEPTK